MNKTLNWFLIVISGFMSVLTLWMLFPLRFGTVVYVLVTWYFAMIVLLLWLLMRMLWKFGDKL